MNFVKRLSSSRRINLILALGFFLWFSYHWFISVESLKWTSKTGQITSVKVDTVSHRRRRDEYAPRISYHFFVDHLEHEGSEQLHAFPTMEAAKTSAQSWQNEPNIQVYYNSENPDENRLGRGEHLGADGFYAVLSLIAFVALLWYYRRATATT